MRALLTGIGMILLMGCAPDESVDPVEEPYQGPPLPWDYEPFPTVEEPNTKQAELGRLLFYDPILSRDQKTACATCHSEEWGLSDGLPVSIGVDGEGATGPGRTGPNQTTRNSPTLWNVAFREELFWDGRAGSLEEQALMPLREEIELDLAPEEAAARIGAVAEYRNLFAEAFPLEAVVAPEQIARALAAFERTFISNLSPYDRYTRGDEGALSSEAQEGMQFFFEAGCSTCHVPPLFESNVYHARVDTGDRGRAEITKDPADAGAFRVPTLRNLRETGPYFHDGSVIALEDAVLLESVVSAEKGDGRALNQDEAKLVAVFLHKGLMDRSREPTRPKTVPSGLEVPKDGLRIPR